MIKEVNHSHSAGSEKPNKLANEALALAYSHHATMHIDKSHLLHQGKPREKGEPVHLQVQGPKEGHTPHFRIGKDGKIAQFKDCRLKENANDKTISIEIEPGGAKVQKQALADLRKMLRAEFNIRSEHVFDPNAKPEAKKEPKQETQPVIKVAQPEAQPEAKPEPKAAPPKPSPIQRESAANYSAPQENYATARSSYVPPESTASSCRAPEFSLNAPLEGATAYDALSATENARIVAKIAEEMGLDPVMAVACMLVESGGNCKAIGDNGTSFGLFQLHKGGHLDTFHLTPNQAFNPATNARCALTVIKENLSKYSNPGQLAAASQRPADPQGYAQKVNASMGEARKLLGMA